MPTFCGCLRNFEAVADAARAAADGGLMAVIPAGEKWPDASLRPAIEDWIGAGAVISALVGKESAEARLARATFEGPVSEVAALVRESVSGRELAAKGFAEDVEIALEIGTSRCAPRLAAGAYTNGA